MQDVPKIVLKGLQSPPAESHPDADLLTAFAEHALVGRERDRIVEHLAHCGDCRDVVMLALPATETLALPAPSGAQIAWFSWPVLRWGVVAAGIVAVTSIGVLQYRRGHQEKIVASNTMHRYAAADTAAQNAPALPQVSASQQAVPKPAQRMRKDLSAAPFPQTTLAEREAAPSAGAMFTQAQPMTRAGSAGGVGGTLGGTAAGTGSGSGLGLNAAPRADSASASAVQNPTPAKPQSPPLASTQQVLVSGANEVVEVQSEAPQINTETASLAQTQDQLIQNQKQLPLNGRNVANLDAVAKSKNPVPAQAAARPASAPALSPPIIPLQTSPALLLHASPRWAISSAGTLQRSFDAGKTWEDINPSANFTSVASSSMLESSAVASRYKAPDTADQAMKKQQAKASPISIPIFRAVAAAGLEVWVGGSVGTLYHSVDGGNRWTLVLPSAAGTILTGDITSIQFADPQHGTVATSNAEIWTTADNGQTWHKQQ